MKNKSLKVTPLFYIMLMFVSVMKAQEPSSCKFESFVPYEAEWYYGYQDVMDQGYVKISSCNDTIIDGFSCRKIKITRSGYGYYMGLHSGPIGYEYLTQINDSVLVYRGGNFYKLFDFGAEIGDGWRVPGREGICEEDFGNVRVVGKGTEIFNGIELKYILLVDELYSYWGYSPTFPEEPSNIIKVVERIGPIGSYFFPEQKCLFDYAEGGPLRCYIDDELGELHLDTFYFERACDYINDMYQFIDEEALKTPLSISPNPCSDKVQLCFGKSTRYEILVFDLIGKVVLQYSIIGDKAVIDLSDFSMGLYCITATDGTQLLSRKIVKQ